MSNRAEQGKERKDNNENKQFSLIGFRSSEPRNKRKPEPDTRPCCENRPDCRAEQKQKQKRSVAQKAQRRRSETLISWSKPNGGDTVGKHKPYPRKRHADYRMLSRNRKHPVPQLRMRHSLERDCLSAMHCADSYDSQKQTNKLISLKKKFCVF